MIFNKNKGWEKCDSPNWFSYDREIKLRNRIGYPKTFLLKGKTFIYKGIKHSEEEQGSNLLTNYTYYKKKKHSNLTKFIQEEKK